MTRADEILQLLWLAEGARRGTQLYAVLDGACDIRIHRMIEASELAWRCLYAGTLPRELREVAPYLVHARPQAVATRELVTAGWGRAWGIWLVSAAPLDEVYRHLRRFLRVQDPRGRGLLFRYYDPLVLGAFLPTCTADQLAALFGPIDAFLVEHGEASAGPELVELRFDGGALHTRTCRPSDDDRRR
jgi:hypothetical protein